MSTNSTMINDRHCWNCKLAENECDSDMKEDINGYCYKWEPTDNELNEEE